MKSLGEIFETEILLPTDKQFRQIVANRKDFTFPEKVITNTEGHRDLWHFHNTFVNVEKTIVTIHFPDKCFIEANMSALLIGICHKLKIENKLSFEIGSCSKTHLDLFQRNGLLSHLHDNQYLKSYDYANTTIKAKLFSAHEEQAFYNYIDGDLLSNESLNILGSYAKDMLRQGFIETFNNIEHIDSDLPLAACGQCFLGKKTLQFTLSDMGVGFLRKISHFTKGAIATPKEALAWAVQGGNSVRGIGEGGSGLSILRKYCELDKRFTFIIITDNHYWKLSDGKIREWSLKYPVVGTTIHLMVKLVKNI